MPGLRWPQHDESNSPKSHRSDLTASDKPPLVRPGGSLKRKPSANTRYMNMLLELDAVPKIHNLLASYVQFPPFPPILCNPVIQPRYRFFTWVLLAGFIIFPGTFTSIQSLDVDDPSRSGAEKWILGRVKNVPLLVIAGVCCVIGAAGMCWLWYRWHRNFIWLVNRIFLYDLSLHHYGQNQPILMFLISPGALHGLAGEISTLVNVFSQQGGKFSTTALVTATVTGACTVVCGVLVIFYSFWKLERVKRAHHRMVGTEEIWDGPGDAGIVERAKRRGKELEPEPGVTV
ncbi:hypothetical protein FRC09_018836 [Ceratobasidium sp. 395]|nr:hypothetical protein FRC09_018836 [Ceratobasidium sp. 395]